jgi:hypothetical protein
LGIGWFNRSAISAHWRLSTSTMPSAKQGVSAAMNAAMKCRLTVSSGNIDGRFRMGFMVNE